MLELAPRITADPEIRFGKPVIKGTRVSVELVVGKLGGGMSVEEVAGAYGIEKADVMAALSYAAASLANERIHLTK